MKGKIDKHGNLIIVRAGEEVYQICRPGHGGFSDYLPHCRNDCPAFGEPAAERRRVAAISTQEVNTGRTLLKLCAEVGTLTFDEFEDEREASDA